MEEIEDLARRQRNLPVLALTANDVERMIMEYTQDMSSDPRAFATIDGGIAEVSARNNRFATLPADVKRNLYIEAMKDLLTRETRYTGGQPTSKFARLIWTALGSLSKSVDILRDPSKITGIAKEFLLPHPNQPTDRPTTTALVGNA